MKIDLNPNRENGPAQKQKLFTDCIDTINEMAKKKRLTLKTLTEFN